jgi:hypothetical protein
MRVIKLALHHLNLVVQIVLLLQNAQKEQLALVVQDMYAHSDKSSAALFLHSRAVQTVTHMTQLLKNVQLLFLAPRVAVMIHQRLNVQLRLELAAPAVELIILKMVNVKLHLGVPLVVLTVQQINSVKLPLPQLAQQDTTIIQIYPNVQHLQLVHRAATIHQTMSVSYL